MYRFSWWRTNVAFSEIEMTWLTTLTLDTRVLCTPTMETDLDVGHAVYISQVAFISLIRWYIRHLSSIVPYINPNTNGSLLCIRFITMSWSVGTADLVPFLFKTSKYLIGGKKAWKWKKIFNRIIFDQWFSINGKGDFWIITFLRNYGFKSK